MSFSTMRLLARKILEHPFGHEWSLQGLGMLRLYLSPEVRLHVWSPEHALSNVSTVHTHPWDFTSTVLAGRLTNVIYREVPDCAPANQCRGIIECGPDPTEHGARDVEDVFLAQVSTERRVEGQTYRMLFDEPHESIPDPGTVTICTRRVRGDPDHARVYWPVGLEWVSSEPRPATEREVEEITGLALERWFK